MALKETVQPVEISFNLVMTAIQTYTEVELELPVNINSNLVFDMDLIEFVVSPSFDPIAAGLVSVNAQLTFNTQAAVLGWQDNDVIFSYSKEAHASAALLHSGVEERSLHEDTRGRANLIARDSVFLGIDSVNCTAVQRIQGRLIGSLTKLKLEQLTQLVLNQLT